MQHEFTRKLILLVILLCVVLGIFFLQQNAIISKSAPQPAPTPIAATSGNIIVTTPFSGANASTDFLVEGKARVPDNVVSLRVTNKVLGKTYFQGQAVTRDPDEGGLGSYSIQVHLNTEDFSLRPNDKLTLDVYHYAQATNTESDIVTIPLIFSPELP
jgi:hypothetical protein